MRGAIIVGLLPFTLASGVAARQTGHLVRASMTVHADSATDRVPVTIRYILWPAADRVVPLAALLFDGSRIENLSAAVEGTQPGIVELAGGSERVTGSIELSSEPTGEITVDITYDVVRPSVPGGRIRIPIVAVLWPPAQALPGTFTATLDVPDGQFAWDAVPSVLQEAVDAEGDYVADLAVVPALIGFRLASGAPPAFTLASVLDASVIILLLVFGWVGWRRFRAESA